MKKKKELENIIDRADKKYYNTRVNRKKPWGVRKNLISRKNKEGQSPFFCYYKLDIEI